MSYFKLKNGEKLYYEDVGCGKNTIVMLHGWTSSHYIYTEPASILKEKARCIIYDHRGHSGSKYANKEEVTMETLAQDLNEIIIGLNLKNITLVGWSMGACAVLNYVRLFGCNALRQIVLCDMSPKLINDESWKLGLYKGQYTQQDRELDERKSSFSQYKKFVLATAPSLGKLPRFILETQLLKRLMKCDIGIIKNLSQIMEYQDNRNVVGEITVPLRYFYSTLGSIFSPELEQWYRKNAVSDFQSAEFPNSTHLLIAENPRHFAEEIEKLLK